MIYTCISYKDTKKKHPDDIYMYLIKSYTDKTPRCYIYVSHTQTKHPVIYTCISYTYTQTKHPEDKYMYLMDKYTDKSPR